MRERNTIRLKDCFNNGMLKKIAPDLRSAGKSMELSMSYIEDAEKNVSMECYRIVMISGYTAMFHAGRAIMFRDGVKERSHECIPLYIKEIYPALEVTANLLDSYRKMRHETLYGLESEITPDDAKAALNAAKIIYDNIDRFLNDKN